MKFFDKLFYSFYLTAKKNKYLNKPKTHAVISIVTIFTMNFIVLWSFAKIFKVHKVEIIIFLIWAIFIDIFCELRFNKDRIIKLQKKFDIKDDKRKLYTNLLILFSIVLFVISLFLIRIT